MAMTPTDAIEFTVFGPPVPFARAGAAGKRRFTPPKQRDYMLHVRSVAYEKMLAIGAELFDGPLLLRVICIYEYPASWSKKRRAETRWKTSRPDVDNLEKAVMDCIGTSESLASYDKLPLAVVYRDDAQIAKAAVEKFYGEVASVFVRVERLT